MGCETASGRFCFFMLLILFFTDASLNIWAYIDGFNLYNGALKGTPYKCRLFRIEAGGATWRW